MKRKAKKALIGTCALLCVSSFSVAAVSLFDTSAPVQVNAADEEATTANYTGIVEGYEWYYHSDARYAVVLGFDQPMASSAGNLSDVSGNTLNITLNGNAVTIDSSHILPRCMKVVTDNANAIELVFFNYEYDGGWTYASGVTSPFAHGTKLEIKDSTVNGYILEDVTLYFNAATNQWQEAEISSVTYEKIEWNNDYGGANVLLLKYSGGTISDSQADLTATLGAYITIGGTKISDMTDGKIESRPDYGAPFLLIQYDTSYATHGAVLVIPENAPAGNAILPALTLYMNAETGQWQDTEPEPLEAPTATYESIFSQDMSGTVWSAHSLLQLQFDTPLAPNTTDIQGSENTANNSGNLSTQLTLGGEHVTMGSQVNFYLNAFAYATDGGNAESAVLEILFIGKKASDFAHGTELHIPAGTLFGEVQLSEVTLYFNATTEQWQADKVAPLVDGFTTEEGAAIRIDTENGGLRFETHIEKSTYDSLVATYGKDNIQLGTYILPEAWLVASKKSLYDYVTKYTAENGYYMDISTWNSAKNDFGFANSNAAGEIVDGNSYYIYYGTIAQVKYENYAENFIGVGYLWITDANGDSWLYLTHDGSWSRSVYEVAKAAYEATDLVTDDQLYGITPYFDKVVEINTVYGADNNYEYEIDSVLSARPSYAYTKSENYTVSVDLDSGVITVKSTSDAVCTVIINGDKAGIAQAATTVYADYYATTPKLFDNAEAVASALNYGIGEPTQELWGTATVDGYTKTFAEADLNANSTASNIAKVNAAFNGNTGRIWFQIADVCWPNDLASFAFTDGAINTLQSVIDAFTAEGVTNISLMSGVANYRSTKNYYKDGTWYSFWEVLNGGIEATPYPNLIVLPGESDYDEFLALQKEYFKQLALQLNGVTVIEVLNELELSTSQFRYYIENGYLPDIELVAQAAMDICKAATEGIKEAGKNIKVAMPSLACVSETTTDNTVTRYDTIKLVTAEYDYIMNDGTGDADDYFQIINIHPYVFLSSATSDTNYLYYENNGLTLQSSTTIAERWTAYIESLRTIFIANGDGEKPIWITEFGIADYEQCGSNSDIGKSSKWSDYRDNTLTRQTMVYETIYDAIQEMPYIDTVIFFRVGDYACDVHSYANCGEASYGVIDTNGNLKDIGKNLYTILNDGSTDYTDLQAVVSETYGSGN